jgi:hypothetical protein
MPMPTSNQGAESKRRLVPLLANFGTSSPASGCSLKVGVCDPVKAGFEHLDRPPWTSAQPSPLRRRPAFRATRMRRRRGTEGGRGAKRVCAPSPGQGATRLTGPVHVVDLAPRYPAVRSGGRLGNARRTSPPLVVRRICVSVSGRCQRHATGVLHWHDWRTHVNRDGVLGSVAAPPGVRLFAAAASRRGRRQRPRCRTPRCCRCLIRGSVRSRD